MNDRNPQSGFTLIEMSVVMAIMGLLLASAASVMSGRVSSEAKRLTELRLSVVNDALTAYYVTNNRLPCPADGSLNASNANYGRAQRKPVASAIQLLSLLARPCCRGEVWDCVSRNRLTDGNGGLGIRFRQT